MDRSGCQYILFEENRGYLGMFPNCHDAVQEAEKCCSQSNGCYYCSYECHTI